MKRKILIFSAMIVFISTVFGSIFSANSAFQPWVCEKREWYAKNPDTMGDYSYSFAIVGDTQILTAYDAGSPLDNADINRNKNYVKNLYKWIVDNKENKKIEYVFGVGDITQYVDGYESEWNVAKEAISQLKGVVPYSMARGNHDNKTEFSRLFYRDEEYMSQFDGQYDNAKNTYRTLSVGGDDYLLITLDYSPTDYLLNWAEEIINKYPNHKVIITTHGYLGSTGKRVGKGDYTIWNGSSHDGTTGNFGTDMWDKLIKNHKNIFMVICGHIGANEVVISSDTGVHGNTVYQVLVDPQDYDYKIEPIGAVALLCFSADGSTFWVQYYSTVKNGYYDLYSNEIVYSTPRFTATQTTTATPTTPSTATATAKATATATNIDIITSTTTATTESTVHAVTETSVLPNTDTVATSEVSAISDQNGCSSMILGCFAILPTVSTVTALSMRKKKRKF